MAPRHGSLHPATVWIPAFAGMTLGVAVGLIALAPAAPACAAEIKIGSKAFTESVVLGEIAAQLARGTGAEASHRRGLGGTRVVWQALVRGDIDAYVEYTGTIAQEIFPERKFPDEQAMRAALAERGIVMGHPLGFNNTYALGMSAAAAGRHAIRTMSDLRAHPTLRLGFSNEFMERADGWPGLKARYGLPQTDVRGLDHDLAYRGLAAGDLDATDVYTTDAEIPHYGLVVLKDDLHYFPDYHAALLYRAELSGTAPDVAMAWQRLAGRIDEASMAQMNAAAKLDGKPESDVAAAFVHARFGITTARETDSRARRILQRTLEHLTLVIISLSAAIIVALPLGILAARRPVLGQAVLAATGIVQTIPSLALLVFMIPLLGIGGRPAIVALFLYSLLPIVRNTYAGLNDIPPSLRESAEALGLTPFARLRLIELPMAARSILAGIKTAAVINVGTATLGALIGAGGYGQPILTGIRRDDIGMILEGAIPAAILALAVQGAFELAERFLVARGLRLKRA